MSRYPLEILFRCFAKSSDLTLHGDLRSMSSYSYLCFDVLAGEGAEALLVKALLVKALLVNANRAYLSLVHGCLPDFQLTYYYSV